jgi:dienelactone hydrolase
LLRRSLLILGLATQAVIAQTTPPATAPPAAATTARAPTLDDLFSDRNVVDAAISPSGRYLAVILRRGDDDALLCIDMQTNERKGVQRTKTADLGRGLVLRMGAVYWKSDERMLLRLHVRPATDRVITSLTDSRLGKLGDRLFAVNRDGTNMVALLGESRNLALEGAFDLGAIASFLPHDPKHILMVLDGFNGRSLFKVDLENGRGEQIERPQESVVGWWLDLEGNPVVRMTSSGGSVRMFRKEGDKWVKFLSMRLREMKERPEYESVGPSDQPGKYYVLARPPGRDRVGLYLYDLEKELFGEPLIENAEYDLASGQISRDGRKLLYHCYLAHVRICEFSDPKINAHMKGLRKYFQESANVYVYDSSEDGKSLLLYVEGPHDPPGYYYYLTEKKQIEVLGVQNQSLAAITLPKATVVRYTARDGKPLIGYLTVPATSSAVGKLPLVVYPHGGPEMRDRLTFDPWVQYFAARGYAVFQPNFRGSDGFGKSFAESGYGEWGRKMQDDISDGLKAIVDQGVADPARVCIVGASYGGYAALAGAALTPDLFKCAVSVAGITDLDDFIAWRKRNWGRDSDGYRYWLKAIGDPEKDQKRMDEVSPILLVDRIKAPVLLIHGADDAIVPIAQSKAMKRALDKAGHKTELLEIAEEGHSYWSNDNEKLALSKIDAFLWTHLGPGAGVTAAPIARGQSK